MTTQHDDRGLVGSRVVSSDNEDVGTVDEVFVDEQTHQPAFVSVKGGIFGMRERMVPLQGARVGTDQVQVPFDRQRIKDAPNSGSADGTGPQATAELYRHYGITRSDLPGQRAGEDAASARGSADTGAGQDRTASSRAGESGDDEITVTRSEEEMHVGTEQRESDRVHVRKRVETEQVERTVPTSREEVRVEREPIADGERAGAATIGEDEHEMTLHEQRPVVSTESVPVERVRVTRDQVQDEETVSGQVHKEHVDVSHDADPDARGTDRGE